MSEEDVPVTAISLEAAAAGRSLGPTDRAARVDSWQRIKKSFAFALASDDYATARLERLSKAAARIREFTAQDPDAAQPVSEA